MANINLAGAGSFLEQVVVETEDAPRQGIQQSAVHQVIFCGGGVGGVSGVSGVAGGAPVITSVLSAGGAVLTPHHSLHH
ncbi:hypothetical protein HF086_008142 [Spodoptera exigua]|uniref:Uncharacterized protein n=1 Tax=Spodoptera exigua TaxID=7107 RepID=A0A922S8X2_SPOEX|nr:hypothetical protein HF086_008142 [Spodoptera exigua]